MDAEERAMRSNCTLKLDVCQRLGVKDVFLQEWREGVRLTGHELANPFHVADYPSVIYGYDRAAEEVDRLASEGKIHWFDHDNVPADVDVCPSTLVIKQARMRLVHDWTRVGLNECLEVPPVAFATLDSLLCGLRPRCHIAGLGVRDCFLHWPVPILPSPLRGAAPLDRPNWGVPISATWTVTSARDK